MITARTKPTKKKGRGPKINKTFDWSKDIKFHVRALAVTADAIVTAGVPDMGQRTKDANLLGFTNDQEAMHAFTGKKGVYLRLYTKTGGSQMAQYDLHAVPSFDGISVAHGKILIAFKDGSIACWGK